MNLHSNSRRTSHNIEIGAQSFITEHVDINKDPIQVFEQNLQNIEELPAFSINNEYQFYANGNDTENDLQGSKLKILANKNFITEHIAVEKDQNLEINLLDEKCCDPVCPQGLCELGKDFTEGKRFQFAPAFSVRKSNQEDPLLTQVPLCGPCSKLNHNILPTASLCNPCGRILTNQCKEMHIALTELQSGYALQENEQQYASQGVTSPLTENRNVEYIYAPEKNKICPIHDPNTYKCICTCSCKKSTILTNIETTYEVYENTGNSNIINVESTDCEVPLSKCILNECKSSETAAFQKRCTFCRPARTSKDKSRNLNRNGGNYKRAEVSKDYTREIQEDYNALYLNSSELINKVNKPPIECGNQIIECICGDKETHVTDERNVDCICEGHKATIENGIIIVDCAWVTQKFQTPLQLPESQVEDPFTKASTVHNSNEVVTEESVTASNHSIQAPVGKR